MTTRKFVVSEGILQYLQDMLFELEDLSGHRYSVESLHSYCVTDSSISRSIEFVLWNNGKLEQEIYVWYKQL